MELAVGKQYETNAGDIVKADGKDGDVFICRWIVINAKGHEGLKGKQSRWLSDGSWEKYPDKNLCLHTILKQV